MAKETKAPEPKGKGKEKVKKTPYPPIPEQSKPIGEFEGVKVLGILAGGKENENDIECSLANGTTTMVPKSLLKKKAEKEE